MTEQKKTKTTKTTKTKKTVENAVKKSKEVKAEKTAAAQKTVKAAKRTAPKTEHLNKDREVRAIARFVPMPPRKLRFVMDAIRGKKVSDALTLLQFTQKAASGKLHKVLQSAVANAENNFKMDTDKLYISKAYVDPGPTQKRYLPRAMGRASFIFRRSSHITIAVKER